MYIIFNVIHRQSPKITDIHDNIYYVNCWIVVKWLNSANLRFTVIMVNYRQSYATTQEPHNSAIYRE